ncbi:MAG TPA: hypothetical protein VF862_10010 [Gemmatimonadales bacterium]
MRRSGWLLVGLAGALPLQAQVVDHTRVRRYAGEDITVRGPIARATNAGGGVVWFSLGKPHPSATLVIIITSAMASNFGDPRGYEGATVEVTGRILTGEMGGVTNDPTIAGAIRGGEPKTPYIVLKDASRFKVVEPPPAPPETPPPPPPPPPPSR